MKYGLWKTKDGSLVLIYYKDTLDPEVYPWLGVCFDENMEAISKSWWTNIGSYFYMRRSCDKDLTDVLYSLSKRNAERAEKMLELWGGPMCVAYCYKNRENQDAEQIIQTEDHFDPDHDTHA